MGLLVVPKEYQTISAESGSTGTFNTATAAYSDITNTELTITTPRAAPIEISLQPEGSGNPLIVTLDAVTGTRDLLSYFTLLRNSNSGGYVNIAYFQWRFLNLTSGTSYGPQQAFQLHYKDRSAPAGENKYKLQVYAGADTRVYVQYAKLCAVWRP